MKMLILWITTHYKESSVIKNNLTFHHR